MHQYETPAQAAARLGVSTRSLHRAVIAGDLRAYRLGAQIVRYRTDELDALMAEPRPCPRPVDQDVIAESRKTGPDPRPAAPLTAR